MASRKMTFTIPEDLASQLLRRVPARDRSRYVTEAIAAKLREREERMIRACEAANNDPDVLAIERDWDAMDDEADRIEEPWTNAPAR
jgi:hypothetical protein